MAFSKKVIQMFNEILMNQPFSEANTEVQKICVKKDSADLALELGELALEKIGVFECVIETPTLQTVQIKNINLRNTVEAQVIETQECALNAMQSFASTESYKVKVDILLSVNKELYSSITTSLQNKNKIQDNTIPMIFAVFSRKNDYYGLGNMGA